MDVVTQGVDILNNGQVPFITVDQLRYTVAKQVRWSWLQSHGEGHFVMVSGLHSNGSAQDSWRSPGGKWVDPEHLEMLRLLLQG